MSGGEKDALSAVEIDRINYLNIVLMVVSLAVATYLPFETFIFAYAFLGPLHYLTEISWLHDRGYFARRPSIVWWFLPAVLLVVASYLFHSPKASRLSLILVSVMVVVSAAFTFASSRITYELCIVMGIVVGYIGFNYEPLATLLLVLLPTLIHVCIFTGIFIIYGALKGRSVSGVLSAVVYLVCPVISVYGVTTPNTYQVSDYYLD